MESKLYFIPSNYIRDIFKDAKNIIGAHKLLVPFDAIWCEGFCQYLHSL